MDGGHLAKNLQEVVFSFAVSVRSRRFTAIVEAAQVSDVAEAGKGEATIVVWLRYRGRLVAARTTIGALRRELAAHADGDYRDAGPPNPADR